MTAEDWKRLPVGTPVRVKIPGANGPAGYLITKSRRAPYYIQGNLWLPLEGHPTVRVRDVEVIPQEVAMDASIYGGLGAVP